MADEANTNKGEEIHGKVYTEEEFNRKLTAEVDRRVESGIQKGLETHKEKWQRELEDRAKLTAEELAQKQIDEKAKELTSREKEIAKRANRIDARDMLSEANVPKAYYDKFLDVLISEDTETTTSNVNNFIEMFNSTKQDIETRLKSELSNVPKPNQGDPKPVSKKDFDSMSYAKKMEFKRDNPEMYKEFIK